MSRYTFRTLMILFFLSSNYLFSYDWLQVLDPRQSWYGGQGTIEEATLSIRPQGLYIEYGLYLTFSAKNLSYTNSDTLEVQFDFQLPENAIVTDMWLWIGNNIMKSLILDKWTASNIYEGIVKRRRDPAILIKNYQGQYNLKVFPMPGKEKRKVKITYLVPATWESNSVSAPLPVNLLNTSYTPVKDLSVIVWPNEGWGSPKILEKPELSFVSKFDTAKGMYLETHITNSNYFSSLNISFPSPMKNGIYLNRYDNGTEGFYQLALQPSKVLDLNHNKKVAFLLDYTTSNSSFPVSDVINNLKNLILSNFSSKDSFNIILSKLEVYRISEKWISADSETVTSIFSALNSNSIAAYSNLPSLLNNGINFIQSTGNHGEILLVSNSDQYGGNESGNQFAKDLLEKMDPIIKINVLDYQDRDYVYNYVNGIYYYGNEYFYTNITKLTKGNFSNIRNDYSLVSAMSNAFQGLNGTIYSFDLYTTVNDGFCYGRFNLNINNETVYLEKPILQTGKYIGNFPFSIQVSGIYNSTPFTTNIQKDINDIQAADSNIQKAWTGNYIHSLEIKQQTNSIISEILDYSIENRILSLYTAMLALEPNDTIKFCKDCYDESELPTTDVTEDDKLIPDSLTLKPFPNPFNSQVQLAVTLPKNFKMNEASFKIYNILGEAVKTFNINEIGNSRSFQLTWNGKSDHGENVASGVYIFAITSPQGSHSVKLMLLK